MVKHGMPSALKHLSGDPATAQQRFLSLFLRSEREVLPSRIGAAELGNWNASGFPNNDPSLIRNSSGAMDEFCLFSRALDADEIRALYSAGKPQPDPVAALNKN